MHNIDYERFVDKLLDQIYRSYFATLMLRQDRRRRLEFVVELEAENHPCLQRYFEW